MCFAMVTACNSKDNKDRDTDKDETAVETTEETEEPTTTTTSESVEHTEKPEPTTEATTEPAATESSMSPVNPGTTLEEVLNRPENKSQMDEQCESTKAAYSSYYSDIRWEVKDNDLSFVYVFAQDYNKDQIDAMKKSLEDSASSLEDQIEDLKASCERDLGVRPNKISYTYLTKSGDEIITISK